MGKRKFSVSYYDQLAFCFFCGIFSGTAAACCLKAEIFRQIGQFPGFGQAAMGREEQNRFWRYLLGRRFAEFSMACLGFATPFASWISRVLFFLAGFCCAFMVSLFTIQDGWRGLFTFLRVMLPHWIFYLPVWIVLGAAAREGLQKLRLRVWCLLILAVFVGIWMEAWVNPGFL